ncbi:Outer membrane lipoprotein carrier protein LolA [Crenothrix polyspora]|uniref:Outer membrane lipoprotein carrier protein LolA n=1 Tax=Crenothrix polyspora TaxID=360316 RepID=A0A1R4H5R6_9GAMM|nr:outer membrane lipoprotein carrier protein LolA [Crenothrix polyspora]SJM91584.1 Outer membrane lipoprotein carrier protein LolA [Crenothrix polyspora]
MIATTTPTFLRALLLFVLSFGQSYADDVLASIAARLVKTPMTQGQFQQEKRLKILRKPLLSTGTFTYHQSKGVIWKTLTPVSSLLLVNDSHLITAQGEQAVPPAFGSVFKALLGGELNRLTEGFSITGKDQKTAWQLQLIPKDALLKKVISTIQLTGDTELRQLELQEVNGNLTQISFTQISHPDHLSSEQQADFERLSP